MNWLRVWIYTWIFHDRLEQAVMARVKQAIDAKIDQLGHKNTIAQQRLVDWMQEMLKPDLIAEKRHKAHMDALLLIAQKLDCHTLPHTKVLD